MFHSSSIFVLLFILVLAKLTKKYNNKINRTEGLYVYETLLVKLAAISRYTKISQLHENQCASMQLGQLMM